MKDNPGTPRPPAWLQTVLGLSAGIVFALALQFGEFVLGYGRAVAWALLPLGLGILIALALAVRAWRWHRAFAVTFLVPVVVVAAVDVVEAITIVVQRGG